MTGHYILAEPTMEPYIRIQDKVRRTRHHKFIHLARLGHLVHLGHQGLISHLGHLGHLVHLGWIWVDLRWIWLSLGWICLKLYWIWVNLGDWVNLNGYEMDLGGYGVNLVVLISS